MMYRSPVSDQRASRANLNVRVRFALHELSQLCVLRAFVDKTKLAQQPDEACILELGHEFAFKMVYSTERIAEGGGKFTTYKHRCGWAAVGLTVADRPSPSEA